MLKVYEQEATELGGGWRYFRLLKVDRNDCCALLLLLSLLGFIAGWVLVLMPPTLPPNCQYAHGSIHEASKSSACLACCMCLHWNPTAAKECGYRQCSNSSSDAGPVCWSIYGQYPGRVSCDWSLASELLNTSKRVKKSSATCHSSGQ